MPMRVQSTGSLLLPLLLPLLLLKTTAASAPSIGNYPRNEEHA